MTKIITATGARKQIYTLIDEVIESHEPVHIKGKQGSVVLISSTDFEAMQETLHLLSIPGMRKSLTEGKEANLEDCDTELEW
jgi:antitoxin YefM